MRKLVLTALLLAPLALSACVTTDFVPSKAARAYDRSPLTERAKLVQEAELKILVASGGQVLGQLESEGAAASSFDSVHGNASEDGAEEGGSHVVLLKSWTAKPQRMAVSKAVQVADGDEGAKHALYLVVRVKPEHWGDLPDALRPVPLPQFRGLVIASIENHRGKPRAVDQPARLARATGPSAPIPAGAIGFVLGSAVSKGAENCVSLGGAFEAGSGRQANCRGPVEAGLDVKATGVELESCEGQICRVSIAFPSEPADAPILQERYSSVRARLIEKYGVATSDSSAPTTSTWSWAEGSTVELGITTEGAGPSAIVRVRYTSAAGARQVRAQGL